MFSNSTKSRRHPSNSRRGFSNLPLDRRRLVFEPLEDRRLLTQLMVNSSADDTIADDGLTTLREAIIAANDSAGADEILFDTNVFATQQTIDLGSQLPTIIDSLTITGPGQDLLTLDAGNGADNTFATNDGYRIFNIDNDSASLIDVTLSALTLTGGDTAKGADSLNGGTGDSGGAIRSLENLAIFDSTISGNATGAGGNPSYPYGTGGLGGNGGGIYSSSGNLTITDSTISGNATGTGGEGGYPYGTGGTGGKGGGIYSSNGNVTISNSNISDNTTGSGIDSGSAGGSGGQGGGIFSSNSNLSITASTIIANTTGEGGTGHFPGSGGDGGNGGGINSINSNLFVNDSTIADNTTGDGGDGEQIGGDSGDGGGIYSFNSNLDVSGSTINGNITGNGGPSFFPGNNGSGGGIYSAIDTASDGSTATITTSTFSGNRATGAGGGILNFHGLMTISQSTITNNTAAADLGSGIASNGDSATHTEITSSILAGNLGTDVDLAFASSNSFQSNGHNLIGTGSATGEFSVIGDQVIGTTSPLLDPLADNGGITKTHALLTGSLALDAGNAAQNTDQRGLTVPVDLANIENAVGGNGSDIGAYELQGDNPPNPSADFDADNDVDGFDFLAWQRGFGITEVAVKTDGDSDDDADVDTDDLAIWEVMFGPVANLLQVGDVATNNHPSSITHLQVETTDDTSSGLVRATDLIDAAMAIEWMSDIKQEK